MSILNTFDSWHLRCVPFSMLGGLLIERTGLPTSLRVGIPDANEGLSVLPGFDETVCLGRDWKLSIGRMS